MVGFHEHVGSALCYKVLTADTLKVIPRGQLRPCTDNDRNLRVDPPDGEENQDDKPVKPVIKSAFDFAPELVQDDNTDEPTDDHTPAFESSPDRPVFNPEDLIGKTFLLDPNDDGTIDRARIVELLEDFETKLDDNPTRIKFRIAVGKDKLEEMITYAKLMDYLQRDEESPPVYWKFKRIISHQKVARNHPDYNGSQVNVMIEWENGEITSEPLKIIAESDPVTCAVYAKENNLLNDPGWKQFKSKAKKDGKFLRLVNKAKVKSYKLPTKYLEKVFANYERMFGTKPKQNVMSPLESGDHPELDTSEFLDEEGITQYQSLIGTLQWVISIGRFDITTHVMSLSSYRIAPRIGHLDRAKRIIGYLAKMKYACIRFRTDVPDYSDLPIPVYDWSSSVYNNPKEILPSDAPIPLGKTVVTTHYCDASLLHDMLTGKSVTAILHFVNQTPCDWYSKKQATVETATYGSEFVAARTCVEQVVDLRNTLRYMGIPVEDRCYMFGDNESVVNSSTTPHGKLHKRHIMLSYHRVREAIASGMIVFTFIPGWLNPADILSKHWSYKDVWQSLKAILFWKGDTADIGDNGG